mgnify:CR=1 FL=1
MSVKSLWAAVAVQAKIDLHKQPYSKACPKTIEEVERHRDSARAWLESNDFECVCDILEVDPDQMRRGIETKW